MTTILLAPFPCTTSPCIDPVFGPTAASLHWSSTPFASSPETAWSVGFADGVVSKNGKGASFAARAVRGGS